MWPTEAEKPPLCVPEAALGRVGLTSYFVILYLRSPDASLDDSIACPPLLPRMLTKPRTVCACQPVVSMISASVAPLARFIIAITSAFLLTRSLFAYDRRTFTDHIATWPEDVRGYAVKLAFADQEPPRLTSNLNHVTSPS